MGALCGREVVPPGDAGTRVLDGLVGLCLRYFEGELQRAPSKRDGDRPVERTALGRIAVCPRYRSPDRGWTGRGAPRRWLPPWSRNSLGGLRAFAPTDHCTQPSARRVEQPGRSIRRYADSRWSNSAALAQFFTVSAFSQSPRVLLRKRLTP